jgi:hypothetical protein
VAHAGETGKVRVAGVPLQFAPAGEYSFNVTLPEQLCVPPPQSHEQVSGAPLALV